MEPATTEQPIVVIETDVSFEAFEAFYRHLRKDEYRLPTLWHILVPVIVSVGLFVIFPLKIGPVGVLGGIFAAMIVLAFQSPFHIPRSLPRRVYNHPEMKDKYKICKIVTLYKEYLSVEQGVKLWDFLYEDCEAIELDTVIYIKLPMSSISKVSALQYKYSNKRLILSSEPGVILNPDAFIILDKRKLTQEQAAILRGAFHHFEQQQGEQP
jgi:hypothetical protein